MISVDDALAQVLALAHSPDPEVIGLEYAAGRVLLEPAVAQLTQPPFNSAAMDGYAIRGADITSELKVIGEAAAGHPWNGTPQPKTAIRIFTGAAVPDGYDRVVMQENTSRQADLLRITDTSGSDNIRPLGGDFQAGEQIKPPRLLSPSDIALFAAMNLPEVVVARRPKVAILSTGDELVRPGATLAAGQIVSSNDVAIAALARDAGADVEILPIAKDTLHDLTASFERASEFDVFVTIGGASVGDHDLVGEVTSNLGMARSFYKIAMRPGKPLMAGSIGPTAMLGLPGNPISSIVCAILFLQPLIWKMQGLDRKATLSKARLAKGLSTEGPRQHYLRASLSTGPDLPLIEAFEDQDSARLGIMAQADALLVRSANDPACEAGSVVDYLSLRPWC